MSRQITIKPIGGLGNRMRAIDSAYQFAQDQDFELRVIWAFNRFLNAPFESLFLPVDGMEVVQVQDRGMTALRFSEKSTSARQGSRWLAKLMTYRADFSLYQDDFAAFGDDFRQSVDRIQMSDFDDRMIQRFQSFLPTIRSARSVYLSSAYRFYPSLKPFAIFRLPADIDQEIHQFSAEWSNVIGVHIRRTDHKKSIQHSSDAWFIKRMDQLLVKDSEVRFFLSTDDPEVIHQMKQRYGHRVIQQASRFDRKDPSAIRAALVDLYLLSNTRMILGSYFSSFSLTAAQIGGIELLIS